MKAVNESDQNLSLSRVRHQTVSNGPVPNMRLSLSALQTSKDQPHSGTPFGERLFHPRARNEGAVTGNRTPNTMYEYICIVCGKLESYRVPRLHFPYCLELIQTSSLFMTIPKKKNGAKTSAGKVEIHHQTRSPQAVSGPQNVCDNGTAGRGGSPRHPGNRRSRRRRWRRAVAAPGRRDPVPEDTHHQPDGAGAAGRRCSAGRTRGAGRQCQKWCTTGQGGDQPVRPT